MNERLTRTGATLTAEGIRAAVVYEKPEAATTYVLTERLRKVFHKWIEKTDLLDIQKSATYRTPKTKDSARRLLDSRLDVLKMKKLEQIQDFVLDNNMARAWSLLLS